MLAILIRTYPLPQVRQIRRLARLDRPRSCAKSLPASRSRWRAHSPYRRFKVLTNVRKFAPRLLDRALKCQEPKKLWFKTFYDSTGGLVHKQLKPSGKAATISPNECPYTHSCPDGRQYSGRVPSRFVATPDSSLCRAQFGSYRSLYRDQARFCIRFRGYQSGSLLYAGRGLCRAGDTAPGAGVTAAVIQASDLDCDGVGVGAA